MADPKELSFEKREQLVDAIAGAINSVSAENSSNTPDFILAEYLVGCLEVYRKATLERERWYGVQLECFQEVDSAGIRDTRRK
jgi:hypothetical protein